MKSENALNVILKQDCIEGMKELLMKLTFIREDLGLQPRAKAKEIRSE